MSLDKFLQIFVTKETKFFPLYIKQAEKIHHATHTLLEMVRTDDFEEQKILGRQIKKTRQMETSCFAQYTRS